MNISEQICPTCRKKNELEAVVCMYCGTALEDPFLDPGAQTKGSDMATLVPESIAAWSVDEQAVPEGGIAIYVEGAFDPVYINTRGEFIIGRKVGDAAENLFDLAPLGGYHLGLSRQHVSIRRTKQGYEICDLGSANGSWLNSERLVPHQFYPLPSGSHVRLGSMRLYVLHRPFEL